MISHRENQLISVLMPVKDSGMWLAQSIDSILKQSYEPLELILVDDDSRDETTLQIIQKAACDARVRVLTPGAVGLVGALNVGLRACQGERIARMDGDDISRLDRISRQVAAMDADESLDLVSSRVVSFPQTALAEGFILYQKWQNQLLEHDEIIKNRFVESPFAHPSVMMKRSVVDAMGGYIDNGWPEDYQLWLTMAAHGKRFGKIPQTLLAWRMHDYRHSFNHARYQKKAFFELKCHYLIPQLPEKLVVVGAGRVGRAWTKALLRQGKQVEALVDVDPAKIGRHAQSVAIIGFDQLSNYANCFIIIAVGKRGQREMIQTVMKNEDRIEGSDYFFVT